MLERPVWTRDFTPHYASQSTFYPCAYNVPSCCSRVLVLPSDIIIAGDGAVVVPQRLATAVLELTLEHEEWEKLRRVKLAEGGSLRKY